MAVLARDDELCSLTDLTAGGGRSVSVPTKRVPTNRMHKKAGQVAWTRTRSDGSKIEKERSLKYDLFLGDLESWYMDSNWTLISQKHQYMYR